jgi:hypothetical protein
MSDNTNDDAADAVRSARNAVADTTAVGPLNPGATVGTANVGTITVEVRDAIATEEATRPCATSNGSPPVEVLT